VRGLWACFVNLGPTFEMTALKGRYPNSYRIDEFRKRDAEVERLSIRARAGIDTFLNPLIQLGLRENMRVLDVGSGSGVRSIALSRFLKSGRVVGVDTSETLLKRANELRRSEGISNVEFVREDLNSLSFPGSAFDFAYMRLVLQHLSDPLKALRNIKRVLIPGGTLFIEDTDRDWMMVYPFPKGWLEYYERVKRGQVRKGGDPRTGRKLADYLRRAGFVEIESMVVPVHGTGDIFMNWLEYYAPTFANNVSEAEGKNGAKLLQAMRRMHRRSPIFLSQLWFQAAGRKNKD